MKAISKENFPDRKRMYGMRLMDEKYPDDIMGIIGIDMATPLAYRSWTDKRVSKMIKMIEIANKLKLYKFPFFTL